MQHPAIGFAFCPLQLQVPVLVLQPSRPNRRNCKQFVFKFAAAAAGRQLRIGRSWRTTGPAAVFNWQIKMRRREAKFCI